MKRFSLLFPLALALSASALLGAANEIQIDQFDADGRNRKRTFLPGAGQVMAFDSQLRPLSLQLAIANIQGLQTALDGKSGTAHAHSNATSGEAGFLSAADKAKLDAIAPGATANDTDANLRARSSHTGSQAISTITGLQSALDGKSGTTHSHSDATTSVPGFMSAADKTKLDGVAAGATANASDAQLRDRSTHTGSQAISTITGLQTALDAGATFASLIAVNGSGPNSGTGRVHWSQIEGMPGGFADGADDGPGASSLTFSLPLRKTGDDVSIDAATTSTRGSMSAADKAKLDGVATGATANDTDANLRARTSHTGEQAISTVTGLQAALDSKAGTSHSHSDATTSAAGFLSAADKTKLDGVAAGAQVNRAIATQAEAEAGEANDKDMTPLRVSQAIAALAPAGGDLSAGATFVAGNITIASGAGELSTIPITWNSTSATLEIVGNITANSVAPAAITGATGNLQVFIGNAGTGNFTKGNITAGSANVTVTKVGSDIVIDAVSSGGDGLPGGASGLWPTASIASPPAGYFAAGQYGTSAGAALGDLSPITRSLGTVANPTVDIAAGAVPAGTVVTMSSGTASPFFTTTNNGTDPTYTVGTVGNTFTVSSAGTWEYRANKQGWISSAVQSAAYTIDAVPTLTSASINGTALTLTYSEAVSRGGSYSNAHFDLDMSTTGSNVAVTYVGGDGTASHTYTAASAAVSGETVDLDFSGAANSVEETSGYNQDLAAIVSGTVSNATSGGGGITYIYNLDYEETGAPAGWSAGESGRDYDYTADPLEGSQSLRLTGPSKYTANTSLSHTSLWGKMKFRVGAIGGNNEVLTLSDSGFTARFRLFISPDGGLFVDASGSPSAETTDSLSANTEYFIWWKFDGTSISVEFNTVDSRAGSGSKFISHTGTGATITNIFLYCSESTTGDFDNVQVAAEDIP